MHAVVNGVYCHYYYDYFVTNLFTVNLVSLKITISHYCFDLVYFSLISKTL